LKWFLAAILYSKPIRESDVNLPMLRTVDLLHEETAEGGGERRSRIHVIQLEKCGIRCTSGGWVTGGRSEARQGKIDAL